MESEIMMYLREINICSVILRLTLATLFGGIIGLERGKKNRPAGFRTHILVCIGSTLAMTTNQYIVQFMGGGDPSRLGAQVISGIGFLGAGTILITGKQQVKGLTTAAGLWASACMGLAIGIGFYEGAIIGCLFIFGVMTILNRLDNHVLGKSRIVDLYIELNEKDSFKELMNYIKDNNMKIKYVEINKGSAKDENMSFFMTIQQLEKKEHKEIVHLISEVSGVSFVEEL
ncbi:MAG: MgtC/SapB family protein [Cellulosilyticaceae bacterium]